MVSHLSAGRTGDFEWSLSNFDAAGQERLQMLNEQIGNIAEQQQRYYQAMSNVQILGTVSYHDYVIVLVRLTHETDPAKGLATPFTFVSGEWRVSNSLGSDETVDVIDAAVRAGQIIPAE
jgi:hypothetical protein